MLDIYTYWIEIRCMTENMKAMEKKKESILGVID